MTSYSRSVADTAAASDSVVAWSPRAGMAAMTTFTDGVLVHAADLNTLSANIARLCEQNTGATPDSGVASKPILKLSQSTAVSIPNSTTAFLAWDTKVVDTTGMWVSGSTITVQTAGWWDVHLQVAWASGAASLRSVYLFINGTANPTNLAVEKDEQMGTGASTMYMQAHLYDHFTVGTTIQAACQQQTGGALSTGTDHGGVWIAAIYDAPY